MPRTIKADGRTITVPDDATPEEINQIVGPAPNTSSSDPAIPDWRDKYTEIQPHKKPTAADNATFGSRAQYVGRGELEMIGRSRKQSGESRGDRLDRCAAQSV